MAQRPIAFLCHSSSDKPLVRSVAAHLRQSGIDIWIDEVELLIGESLIERLGQAIYETDVILAFISRASASSSWVQKELSLAMTREVGRKKVTVLPVLIEDCDLPYFLRDKLYADLRDLSRFSTELNRIFRAIARFSEHRASPPAEEAVNTSEASRVLQLGDVDLGGVIHNRGDSYQGFRTSRTNKVVGVFAFASAALFVGLYHRNRYLSYFLLVAGSHVFLAAALLAVSGALFEMAFDRDRNLLLELEARGGFVLPFGRRWRELYGLSKVNRFHPLRTNLRDSVVGDALDLDCSDSGSS